MVGSVIYLVICFWWMRSKNEKVKAKAKWSKKLYHIETALDRGYRLPSLKEALVSRMTGKVLFDEPLLTGTSVVYFVKGEKKKSLYVAFSEYKGILKHILARSPSNLNEPFDNPTHPVYAESRYFKGSTYRSCHDLRNYDQRIGIEEPPIKKIIEIAERNGRVIETNPIGKFGNRLENIAVAIGNKKIAEDYARFIKKKGSEYELYLSTSSAYKIPKESEGLVKLKFVFCPGTKPKIACGFSGRSIGLVVGHYDYWHMIDASSSMNDYGRAFVGGGE